MFDGCSNRTCGQCALGATCINGLCSCVPSTGCGPNSCGVLWNGCNDVDCGNCQSPLTCNPTTQQCQCVAATCPSLGLNCGNASNGCGGTLNCGSCSSGYYCLNGQCIPNGCTPTTSCAQAGQNCGTLNNGCNTVSCGTCTSPNTCNSTNQCSCTPTTSCEAATYECGVLFDGCQNIACGSCNGQSNVVCTQGQCICTPTTTCAQAGQSCGTLFDGCNYITCGTCQSPATCSSASQCEVEVSFLCNLYSVLTELFSRVVLLQQHV